jgi:hypothetical protein
MTPDFASGMLNRADSLATMRSQANANSKPPPIAHPDTHAMTGLRIGR